MDIILVDVFKDVTCSIVHDKSSAIGVGTSSLICTKVYVGFVS